ncbi:hypothetical protein X875_13370 [Mannheimia varigena USDA-ARS-USMARC-1388]|uniref:Uncharacterized protein n=1 Tax=Mannheimia varigena USDA-ARS-USMARC-1296 TaxID=1433287 RepID=W0QBP8_9PAST|nr:hypothetical protein X808_7270 [Mannheimia varigena USDA-ARS-USMARC-1296]AHG79955.1 hypothetical protein X875_13370 [Mannheimia varigena USDA-ARS-USMARC-1388]
MWGSTLRASVSDLFLLATLAPSEPLIKPTFKRKRFILGKNLQM